MGSSGLDLISSMHEKVGLHHALQTCMCSMPKHSVIHSPTYAFVRFLAQASAESVTCPFGSVRDRQPTLSGQGSLEARPLDLP